MAFYLYFDSELDEEGEARPPPRLFCDICDIFDAHDTDDCPIQAMDEEDVAPSQHHYSRSESRTYCDTCEG